MSYIIGIDNGLDGALCAVTRNGALVSYTRMPTYARNGKTEVDVVKVNHWCSSFEDDTIILVPEEPLKHAKTSQAMRSMGISYGKLLALAELAEWECRPVEVKDWQKKMLGKVPKGKTKEYALKVARELLPEETWVPPGCRVPHDGVVDAFLIARYFLQK